MLSVIVPTNRSSGVDLLIAGLGGQTFRDFEFILVDEIERRTFEARDYGFAFKHIKLTPTPRWGRYMEAMNAGLRAATGERVIFWSDFSCPAPDALAAHAELHDRDPEAVAIAPIEYCELPTLRSDFPLKYGWLAMGHDVSRHTEETYRPWLDDARRHQFYEQWRVAYEADLDSGRLDPFMWSVFEKPVTSWDDVKDLRVFNHDRRDTSPFLNLKNDSIPRSLLEKIGGFDERADGCHGHQDSITWRQLAKAGARLVTLQGGTIRLADPHGLFLVRRMERPDTSNLALYEGAA